MLRKTSARGLSEADRAPGMEASDDASSPVVDDPSDAAVEAAVDAAALTVGVPLT